MLTPSQLDRIDVLLVSPRNPLNIGAAARAMANFGFRRLSIVAPFAMNWMEAKSAVGAPDLLREAQVFETLAEAVAHATLVFGTGSLDKRKPVQTILGLPEAAAQIRMSLASSPPGAPGPDSGTRDSRPRTTPEPRIALLFGSEKHGLTSEDLSWCHALIAIETSQSQPSINLGQAVAICLYELSRTPGPEKSSPGAPSFPRSLRKGWETASLPEGRIDTSENQADPPGLLRTGSVHPDSGQLDRLAALIEETMEAVNYTTRGMRSANGEALRVLLRRLMPNEADLRRMMGFFRRILWQLKRTTGKP